MNFLLFLVVDGGGGGGGGVAVEQWMAVRERKAFISRSRAYMTRYNKLEMKIM
jgi:hypothetical protein